MRLIDADALKDPLELQQASYARIGATERAEAFANCLWEIEQSPTIGGWISVKDRLPEESKTVLVARKYIQPGHKERRYVETAERIGFDWVSVEDEYKVHRQFHTPPYAWMPLPEPPKEDT